MQIRSIKKDEIEIVAFMMSEAYLYDPLWITIIPSTKERKVFLEFFFQFQLEFLLRNGIIEVTDRLDAVIGWIAPNRNISSRAYVNMNFFLGLLGLSREETNKLRKYLEIYKELSGEGKRVTRPTPCWQLYLLAVDPEKQRQGFARTLLRRHIRRLDNQNASAISLMHTEICSKLLKKHRFRVLETGEILESECTYHLLLREASGRMDMVI